MTGGDLYADTLPTVLVLECDLRSLRLGGKMFGSSELAYSGSSPVTFDFYL